LKSETKEKIIGIALWIFGGLALAETLDCIYNKNMWESSLKK